MVLRYRLICVSLFIWIAPAHARDLPLHLIQLPPGFKISLYASDVPNARAMSISPSGTLFVGSQHAGKVYALRDNDNDGHAEKVYVIASNLNSPNGVAFYKGALYVAEINRILRFDDIEYHLTRPPQAVVVSTDFPSDAHHGWKFIRIGPDKKLYVPIGAPCNVCIEYGYAVITRLNLDGTQHEVYAEGVRNTVGFDWHPDSQQLWFTDNGRDMMDDELPADELNRASKQGQHFGFPHCHGGDVIDPDYGLGHSCKEYVTPVQKLGTHVASSGMRFYTGSMFPRFFNKQVFIAEHGSRIRSQEAGYRISLVRQENNKALAYEVFAKGWLQGQSAWGRPVDVEQLSDGSLLVSDDKAGAIYRIHYTGDQTAQQFQLESASQSQQSVQQQELQPATDKKVHNMKQPAQVTTPANVEIKTPQTKQTREPVAESQPPANIHEALKLQRLEKQATQTRFEPDQDKAEQSRNSDRNVDAPPADLLEKIHQQAEQENSVAADPFAPVKTRLIEE